MNGQRWITVFTIYASAVCLLFGYASYRGAGGLLDALPGLRTRSGGGVGGMYHK